MTTFIELLYLVGGKKLFEHILLHDWFLATRTIQQSVLGIY